MSKMSNLDLVLDEMITTGQKMIDAATALKEMFSETAPEMSNRSSGTGSCTDRSTCTGS